MQIKWKTLIYSLALPLAAGGLAGFLTKESMGAFGQLNQPPLSPPGWLFPVVWTILYLLMGLAFYMVTVSDENDEQVNNAKKIYYLQLAVNFFWSIIFFNMEQYLFAFLWLILLWILIIVTLIRFYRIQPLAGYLMIPYLLWVTFAGYLNFGVFLLN
ncbi:MAG: tryptophan-rich sensory protein [Firmicutes bacterium]|nr:tryptophan-rich sensory protein [Bacillota bacterium]